MIIVVINISLIVIGGTSILQNTTNPVHHIQPDINSSLVNREYDQPTPLPPPLSQALDQSRHHSQTGIKLQPNSKYKYLMEAYCDYFIWHNPLNTFSLTHK